MCAPESLYVDGSSRFTVQARGLHHSEGIGGAASRFMPETLQKPLQVLSLNNQNSLMR